MPAVIWSIGGVGSGSGLDYNDGGSWVGGVKPATGEVAAFPRGRTVINAGFNQSGVSLNRIITHPESDIEFTAPLQTNVNNGSDPYIDHRGKGVLPVSGTVTKAVTRGPRGGITAYAGTWGSLLAFGGENKVETGCAITALYARGGNFFIDAHASSRIAMLLQRGGTIISLRDIVDGRLTGPCRLRLQGDASIADGTTPNPVASIYLEHPQALLQMASSAVEAGDMHIIEGEVDMDEMRGDIDIEALTLGPTARFPLIYRGGAVTVNGTRIDLGPNEPGR